MIKVVELNSLREKADSLVETLHFQSALNGSGLTEDSSPE